MLSLFRSSLSGAFLAFFLPTLSAADPSAAEVKLRENLRNAMLQLRTMQTERDTLQAAKTQLDQEKQALTEQMNGVTRQLATDKESADKTIAELKKKGEERELESAQLKQSLEESKAAHQQANVLATGKEAQRRKLAGQIIQLQRQVADQQRKNAAMYKVGMEILNRYEKFGLGTALSAREPFVGTMKVKLQNLVQDYGDQLAEQKIKP